VVVAT